MRLPERILFVGAHCDDVELLAGGLLARACREGATVGVLVFSDHRGVLDDAGATQAREELRGNLGWLREQGAQLTDHTDYGDLLPACQGAFEARRGDLYAALEALRSRYDLVVTHPERDTNQDHRQVSLEATRVFKAHASVLYGEFPNNDLGDGRLSVWVPLEERDLEAKVRMVGAYASQRIGGRPYLDADVIRALARLRGSQIRAEAAEAFGVGARLIVGGTPRG